MEEIVLPTDSYSLPFGRYLKAIRIQKGISIEAVADEIKVSPWQLSLIEAEDHDRLPGEVYVKGLLRGYARYIGVDEDDIVDRYVVNKNLYQGARTAETKRLQFSKRFLPGLLLALGALIIIVVLSIYMIHGLKPHPVTTVKEKTAPAVTAPLGAVMPATKKTGKLFLEIDAVEETWIKVNIDGQEQLKYLMHPMDHIELEATSRFNLLIGNAQGLKMMLNGRPVSIPGKSGQTVNLELPPQKTR